MRRDDLITVLMPAYNAAEFIGKAVDSVLAQTYANLELLILDDGSTDQTRNILSRCRDARIRVVERPNRGLGATLREGVQLAGGRYIARMDADDECVPERLAVQKQFLEDHATCGLVHSWVDFIDKNDHVLSRNVGIRADNISTKWQLIWKNAVIHPTVMIDSDVLTKHGINYDKELRSSEDLDLWNRLARVSDIEIIPKALLRYRIHENNFTKTNQKDFHFDYFVRVLKENFAMYGLSLDARQARELAVISEHTQVDPRNFRYATLEKTLGRLYRDANEIFREYHGVKGGELDRIQGEQFLNWSRYMLNTSRQYARELLLIGFRKNSKIFLRKFFWLVVANIYLYRGLQPAR